MSVFLGGKWRDLQVHNEQLQNAVQQLERDIGAHRAQCADFDDERRRLAHELEVTKQKLNDAAFEAKQLRSIVDGQVRKLSCVDSD